MAVATQSAVASLEASDAELIENYRAGSDVAFSELIRRHQIGVFRLLVGLLGNGDEAERECEKVFFDAAQHIDELGAPTRFYPWVLSLARGRATKVEAQRNADSVPQRSRPVPRNPRALVKQQVRDILGELSGDERLALILADLQDESYQSIASTLETTAEEARGIVENARTKFRTALGDRADHEAHGAASERAPMLAVGQVLGGRFRIEEYLGRGGMGAVHRAVDLESNQPVALKTLLPQSRRDPVVRRRFEREAEIIRRVEHPLFVRCVTASQEPGEPEYVVMEFVDGRSLSRVLAAEHRLAPRRALLLTRQILTGLCHAHGVGVVHRDIKPDNVLLIDAGEPAESVKILDLGIAKLASHDDGDGTRLTQRGEVFGTPAYMAPEQVRGEEVDGRADLYSLSAMLFEMLTSRPPFESKTSLGLLAMHLTTPPPRLAEVLPGLRAAVPLESLLDRGLAKEPAARFTSAAEYLDRVDQVLGAGVDEVVSPDIPEGWPAPPPDSVRPAERLAPRVSASKNRIVAAPRRRGSRWPRIVFFVLTVCLAALTLWLAWVYLLP